MMLHERVAIRTSGSVYAPMEDSYLLADAVEQYSFGSVLDMGTGSGLQGIVAAMKGCSVTFADIDPQALACARRNARANGVTGRFVASDLFAGITGRYNTIVFNPPYLDSAPGDAKSVLALDGGRNGREVIERFLLGFRAHVLRDHLVLLVESSVNSYADDLRRLGAEIVGRSHFFFEDIVVLKFT